MDIHYNEKPVTKMVNGKKFTTYIDSRVEHFDDICCPFCNKVMKLSTEEHCTGQNTYAEYFTLYCDTCLIQFKGLNDNHEFKNVGDFLLFCKEKVDSIIRK